MVATTMKRQWTESNVTMLLPGEAHQSAFHVYQPQPKRVRVSSDKKQKRVSFAQHEGTMDGGSSASRENSRQQQPLHHDMPTPMTDEDRRMLWYQKDELLAAKQHMKYLILHGSDEANGSDEMSGLHRYGWERSQHKRSAIHYVIEAHREFPKNHDFVREVSKRCTQWARHLAEEEGFATFCQVYGDPVQIDAESWDCDVSMVNNLVQQTQFLDSSDENAKDTPRIPSVTPPPSFATTTC